MVVPGIFVGWFVVNLQHARRNFDTEPLLLLAAAAR
jgi:hypothetical protein